MVGSTSCLRWSLIVKVDVVQVGCARDSIGCRRRAPPSLQLDKILNMFLFSLAGGILMIMVLVLGLLVLGLLMLGLLMLVIFFLFIDGEITVIYGGLARRDREYFRRRNRSLGQ